ncbi:hypothetical protein CEXT_197481 [Caerostris extrusa]|uniref:Uncharacterized protein n=1 Tax=Caerostris extrusa TaxID=172846 RepID=A0AAV4VNB4_CAEEX|nr:hypothetical protein CEXT_197481 [Caerostris extrusa]
MGYFKTRKLTFSDFQAVSHPLELSCRFAALCRAFQGQFLSLSHLHRAAILAAFDFQDLGGTAGKRRKKKKQEYYLEGFGEWLQGGNRLENL